MNDEILCIGEILWDALPLGLLLGGAPFNVGHHLHELGEDVNMISRVGDDVLGHEALRRLRAKGMQTESVQLDPSLHTGFVEVSMNEMGIPDYDIVDPAAWDAIQYAEDLGVRAENAAAVVFGTLAQRAPTSRETIQTVSRRSPLAVLDINLRPPFSSEVIVDSSLLAADVVKMNGDELLQLRDWYDLPDDPHYALALIASRFECHMVCVTRGEGGATMWRDGEIITHEGYPVEARDTVGAGDAFLAALLLGLLEDRNSEEILSCANKLGAYVATQFGGTPSYEVGSLDEIQDLRVVPSEKAEIPSSS